MPPSMHETHLVPHTHPKPINTHPRFVRLAFHTIVATIMYGGFTGLEGMAVSKVLNPQVSSTIPKVMSLLEQYGGGPGSCF